MRAAYVHHEALTFSDYIDGETGKTLHAEPGRVYEVTPASGHVVPEIPAAWFVPVDEDDQADPDRWPVGPEAEGGTEPEPETGNDEPGTEQDPPEPSEF